MSLIPSPRALAANIWDGIMPFGRATLEWRKKQTTAIVKDMALLGHAYSHDQIAAYSHLYDMFNNDEELQEFESEASNQLHPGPITDPDWKEVCFPLEQALPVNGWPSSHNAPLQLSSALSLKEDMSVVGIRAGMYNGKSSRQAIYIVDIGDRFVPKMRIENVPNIHWWAMAQIACNLVRSCHASIGQFHNVFTHNGAAIERDAPYSMIVDIVDNLLPRLPATEDVVRVYFDNKRHKKMVVGMFWSGYDAARQYAKCYVDLPKGTHVLLTSSNWQSTCVIFDAAVLAKHSLHSIDELLAKEV